MSPKKHNVPPKVKEIEQYMSKLKNDQIPTFADLKKFFCEQLHLHPDKAEKESRVNFQEIMEAAIKVVFLLVENQELQQRNKWKESNRNFKCFEKERQSIVFQ